jgi:hypothetical protein
LRPRPGPIGLFRFGLTCILLRVVSPKLAADLGRRSVEGAGRGKRAYFLTTEMISDDSGFVKDLFDAAAIARRKDRASPRVCRSLRTYWFRAFLAENRAPFFRAPPAQAGFAGQSTQPLLKYTVAIYPKYPWIRLSERRCGGRFAPGVAADNAHSSGIRTLRRRPRTSGRADDALVDDSFGSMENARPL